MEMISNGTIAIHNRILFQTHIQSCPCLLLSFYLLLFGFKRNFESLWRKKPAKLKFNGHTYRDQHFTACMSRFGMVLLKKYM